MTEVGVIRLSTTATIPKMMKEGDLCFDLYADLGVRTASMVVVGNQGPVVVKTGIAFDIPHGYGWLIKGRSGLAAKDGIVTLGGVIDQGYQGEIGVILAKLGVGSFNITHGARIAQIMFVKKEDADLVERSGFASQTSRGAAGFGSSGVSSQ